MAVGLDAPVLVEIDGHVGYYCGGMSRQAVIRVNVNAEVGAEHDVRRGLVVEADALTRCGVSMKGIDI